MLTQVLSAGDVLAIAPQVLAEFIHVVTDPRRFTQPLDMNAARHVAEQWWTASDVVQAFPDAGVVRQFLTWLQQFSLGRKRLLDTLLAATYRQAGIQSLLTTNQSGNPLRRRLAGWGGLAMHTPGWSSAMSGRGRCRWPCRDGRWRPISATSTRRSSAAGWTSTRRRSWANAK